MNMASSALLGLLAFLAVTDSWLLSDGCVDITKNVPCENLTNGKYHVCNACNLGYFAKCQDENVIIMPCPHAEDENGEYFRLVFNPLTQTCVEHSPSCAKTCVDLNDDVPCENLTDGKYHLCDECHQGYVAKCQDRKLELGHCPKAVDENGNTFKLLFDPLTNTCAEETLSCPRPRQ